MEGYLAEGYRRIKVKIQPGWDVEVVAAVRERCGDDVPLQIDANTAYRLGDARHLSRLDGFALLLVEQPFPAEQLRAHAELARRIGRAANVALAALPGMTLPGDVSASARFYATDVITAPFVMEDGHLRVPDGPGLGVEVDHAVLEEVTTTVRTVRPHGRPA